MKKYLLAVFILALVMLVLPTAVRFNKNPTLAGAESYYHSRMAVALFENWVDFDSGTVQPREYVLNPYHLILAGSYSFLGPRAFTVVPFLFALVSLVLFLRIISLFYLGKSKLWIMLAFALSPPFIASGFLNTPHSFVLTLFLAGLLLWLSRLWIAGAFLLLLAAFTGVPAIIAVIASLFLLIFLGKGKMQRNISLIFLVILLFASGFYSPLPDSDKGIAQYISDLGGMYGLSIFALLLAIVGSVQIWKHKKLYYGAYATGILFFVFSFFFPDLLVFVNLMVCALAGVALTNLAKRKWQISFLRDAALLVIFCGLLFSGISQGVSLAKLQPNSDFFKSLEFEPGVVFSHPKYGFWIEAAGHKAVIDSLSGDAELTGDVFRALNATQLDQALVIIAKYNVTHVLLTREMKQGLFWERDGQGLSFLVSNEIFKRVHESKLVGVWQVDLGEEWKENRQS